MNIRWDNGAAFLGKVFVGCIERDVPVDWRETCPEIEGDDFSAGYRRIVRKDYARNEANPWTGWFHTGAEDSTGIGRFPSEEDAKRALEAVVADAVLAPGSSE